MPNWFARLRGRNTESQATTQQPSGAPQEPASSLVPAPAGEPEPLPFALVDLNDVIRTLQEDDPRLLPAAAGFILDELRVHSHALGAGAPLTYLLTGRQVQKLSPKELLAALQERDHAYGVRVTAVEGVEISAHKL